MEQGKTLTTKQTIGTTYKSVVSVYWFCDEELGIYSKSYVNHYGNDVTKFYKSAKAVANAYKKAIKNQQCKISKNRFWKKRVSTNPM